MLVVIVDDFSGYVGYSSPIIAALSVVVFMLFKGLQIDDRWTERLWKIDRLCFGFLSHPSAIREFRYISFERLRRCRFDKYC